MTGDTYVLTNSAEQQMEKTNKLSRDIGLIEQTATRSGWRIVSFYFKKCDGRYHV